MEWVADYIKIPFQEHGRNHEGVDCWGLGRLIYREQLLENLPSYATCYDTTRNGPRLATLIEDNRADWFEVEAGSEQEFDAVLVRMRSRPIHIGFVVKPGLLIHAQEGVGVALEQYHNFKFEKRIIGFFRHSSMRFYKAGPAIDE